MTTQITAAGFSRDTLADLIAQLRDSIAAIPGVGTNLDPSTIDGQIIGVYAEQASNILQVLEDVYNSFNPAAATGAALGRLGLLNGVNILAGTNAQITVSVTMDIVGAPAIPAGSLIVDTITNVEYSLDNDAGPCTMNPQTFTTTATATSKGTVDSVNTNAFAPATPIFGWASVAMTGSMVTHGVAAETWEQFRIRRAQSVATPSLGLSDSLRGALANLSIGRVHVFENSSASQVDIKPGDHALPPHSMAIVVQTDSTAIRTVVSKYIMGPLLIGSSSYSVSDSQGEPQIVSYSVAAQARMSMIIHYRERSGQGFAGATGEALVQTAVAAWFLANQDVGADVAWGDMFAPILAAVPGRTLPTSITVEELLIGAPGFEAAADWSVPYNQIAALAAADITLVAV
jgi:Baseplate J-like protein